MVRSRAEKEELVEKIREVFGRSETVFLVSLAGITSNEVNRLRAELRSRGARVQVVKNRLARRAASDGPFSAIDGLFRGPTAIVYHETEPVATAKALNDLAKEIPKLEIRGGLVGKRDTVDAAGVKAVADLPSLDQIRAQLLAVINTPATMLVRLINTPAVQLSTVMMRRAEQEAE
ncbi:MAG: 50S ribosomal protein L10 [Acidobacteria bacterium]|nr:50S ribosomal protein L10 [Acidobacteriota bacterium]